MTYDRHVSDQPIWSESELRSMVADSHRSAQTRSWAVDRIERMCGNQAAVALAVDLLDADDPHVATHAVTMLDDAHAAAGGDQIAHFASRDDIADWARHWSTVLLASFGRSDAQQRAFGCRPAHLYLTRWACRDPVGFSRAAATYWSGPIDPESPEARSTPSQIEVLKAFAVAAIPDLAGGLVEAIGRLPADADGRQDLLVRVMAQAGFGWPAVGQDVPIGWHLDRDDLFDFQVDRAAIDQRFGQLKDLIGAADWDQVTQHCLDTTAAIAHMGARDIDAPPLQWALAVKDALQAGAGRLLGSYERANLAFGLQEAVLVVFDIETTLDQRGSLDTALGVYQWSVGAQRDRLDRAIQRRWMATDPHRQAISSWLDDIGDPFDWFDALEVAASLPDYDISPAVMALVDQMADPRAGWDVDAAAETLLAVAAAHPQWIVDHADRLLRDDALVADCTLLALGEQPWRWASQLILDRFDTLAATDENPVLWETLAKLGDPDSLAPMLDRWQPGTHRLAHAIGFVADLAGRLDELPDGVRNDLDDLSRRQSRYEGRMHALVAGDDNPDIAVPDGGPIEVALTCMSCHHTDTYAFDELYLDDERGIDLDDPFGAILMDRVVQCRQCHARDDYQPTARAEHKLAAMITALDRLPRWPAAAPVQVWHPELWDGSSFRTPSEALTRLRSQAEARPDHPERWRRLGHLCTRFHADADALTAYQHAHHLDGRGVPDPRRLRDSGIPTAPVARQEADELLDDLDKSTETARQILQLDQHPLHECLVSARWQRVENLASVFVSRTIDDDHLVASAFLVDLGCQGVKEIIFAHSLDTHRYTNLKDQLSQLHGRLDQCPPELAARILDTAVRFSLALGFFPPDEYFAARRMLAGFDPDAATEHVPTGESGVPVYVGDPNGAEPTIERLYRRTGPDGFASL